MTNYLLSQFRHRPVRALGVIGGVSLGAALFVVLTSLGAGFQNAAKAPLENVAADLLITRLAGDSAATPPQPGGSHLPFGSVPFNPDELDQIKKTTGVTEAAGALEIWDFGGGEGESRLGAQYLVVVGLDPAQNEVGPGKAITEGLLAGRMFGSSEVGVAVADRHYAGIFNLKPGDEVTISQKKFTLVGVAEQKGASQAGVANLYVPLAEAQRLANTEEGQINQVYVRAADAGRVDAIIGDLNTALGPVSAVSQESILQVMGGMARISAQFSAIAGLVGMAGGWALAWVALAGLMAERHREVGIMKAVGWRRREVSRIFMWEFFVLGLLGGLLGIVLGLGAAEMLGYLPGPTVVLNESIPGITAVAGPETAGRLQAQITLNGLALAALIAISGVMVAGWMSVRSITRLKPSQTLRSS